MSGAKLIKKHEPDMSSEIINDKERTNNIKVMKLLVALFYVLLLSGHEN